jgi:hypothetical protein
MGGRQTYCTPLYRLKDSSFYVQATVFLKHLLKMYPFGSQAAVTHAVYHGFTTEVTIPFDYSELNADVPFTGDVYTAVQIGSGSTATTYHPIIDTGTCGFVVSANGFPDWNSSSASAYPVGWEFLSSSKRLYSGHWIPKDIYFTNSDVRVKSSIPILAVEAVTVCPNYNETTDTNVCPTPTNSTAPVVTPMPTGIQVMGVGFGREADGQPQGTPDKNAFLNVQSIDGIPVLHDPLFRNGYIIAKDGVTIGLTEANTAGMNFSKLTLRPNAIDSQDWSSVQACMSVDGANCTIGPALIDTGVAQMYMTLPLGTKVNRTITPLLNNGSTVDVRIGIPGDIVAAEHFIVGDAAGINEGVVPSSVRLSLADPIRNPPHVNTGRHFLRAWKVSFDACGGFMGFSRA